jgi:hypothetical protein
MTKISASIRIGWLEETLYGFYQCPEMSVLSGKKSVPINLFRDRVEEH